MPVFHDDRTARIAPTERLQDHPDHRSPLWGHLPGCSCGTRDEGYARPLLHLRKLSRLAGNSAMLGSANLTNARLKSNREIALAIDSTDEVFDEIPPLFDDL